MTSKQCRPKVVWCGVPGGDGDGDGGGGGVGGKARPVCSTVARCAYLVPAAEREGNDDMRQQQCAGTHPYMLIIKTHSPPGRGVAIFSSTAFALGARCLYIARRPVYRAVGRRAYPLSFGWHWSQLWASHHHAHGACESHIRHTYVIHMHGERCYLAR